MAHERPPSFYVLVMLILATLGGALTMLAMKAALRGIPVMFALLMSGVIAIFPVYAAIRVAGTVQDGGYSRRAQAIGAVTALIISYGSIVFVALRTAGKSFGDLFAVFF